MAMYECKHFAPHELITPEIWAHYTDKNEIYGLFDPDALRILDLLRGWAGVPLTVNNWKWGGNRRYCGLRERACPVGARHSPHKRGQAFDIITPRLTSGHLWFILEAHADELPCKIRIEHTCKDKPITWLHFDTAVAPRQVARIYYFNA